MASLVCFDEDAEHGGVQVLNTVHIEPDDTPPVPEVISECDAHNADVR